MYVMFIYVGITHFLPVFSKSISMKQFSSSIFLLFTFAYLINAATVVPISKAQQQIQQNSTQSNQMEGVSVTQKSIVSKSD